MTDYNERDITPFWDTSTQRLIVNLFSPTVQLSQPHYDDYEKHMSFLIDYYQCGVEEIAKMLLTLDSMPLECFYNLTLAGYKYVDGVMVEPPPFNWDNLGIDLTIK